MTDQSNSDAALVALCERVFRHAHSDGWRANQFGRLAHPAAVDEAWHFYVKDGALAKSIEATAAPIATPAADVAELCADWQQKAALPDPPTALTLEYRRAIQGEGPHAYNWLDKPHRLVFDLCREIERLTALSRPSPLAVEQREAVARIIDPHGWQLADRSNKVADELEKEGSHGKASRMRDDAHFDTKHSLTTADAILALLASSSPSKDRE